MKKIILSTFILILSLCFLSSTTIYSGESITLELEKNYKYYSVVGNSSEVILDIIQNGNLVTITPSKYSVGDTYELIFFDTEKEVVNVYSGGGTKTITEEKKVIEYIEVPNTEIEYIDREIEKEIEVEKENREKPLPVWFMLSLVILIVLMVLIKIIFSIKRYINSNTSERRTNNNE